jgi:hypothetical protein
MTNYFLVAVDVLVDSETLLVTDFVNLKIKSVQFFKSTHKDSVYIYVFPHSYITICVSKKRKL